MTEQQEQKTTWEWKEIGNASDFVKFEPGVRMIYAITNIKRNMVQTTDFNDKTKMIWTPEFYADVIAEAKSGADKVTKVNKKIKTFSKAFISAVKPLLQNLSPDQTVFLSIKRIGEGTKTAYDVEIVKPLPLA
jgi:hypothetical protein